MSNTKFNEEVRYIPILFYLLPVRNITPVQKITFSLICASLKMLQKGDRSINKSKEFCVKLTNAWLAKQIGVKENTISVALSRLKKVGLIEIFYDKGREIKPFSGNIRDLEDLDIDSDFFHNLNYSAHQFFNSGFCFIEELSPELNLFLFFIQSMTKFGKEAMPSRHLARLFGISERTVRYRLKILQDLGYINRTYINSTKSCMEPHYRGNRYIEYLSCLNNMSSAKLKKECNLSIKKINGVEYVHMKPMRC